jgi:ABC-type multidrug transport system permease subunit
VEQVKLFFHVVATVIWEKWVEFKFEWLKITASALISPMLYMIALGWGLGSSSSVSDRPYIDFLVPGIIALTTMNTSFSAVGQPLNVQRLFEHSFDQIIISPTPMPAYIVGQMLGGSLRGIYSGVLILLLSVPFGAHIRLSAAFFLVMLLNGMAFSALGTMAAILAKTHGDIARFSTYAILPMTFLCNTFFPLDRVPAFVKALISILPLTHASSSLRALAYGASPNLLSIAILALYAIVFMLITNVVVIRRENL